jgi:hypothetical protein
MKKTMMPIATAEADGFQYNIGRRLDNRLLLLH